MCAYQIEQPVTTIEHEQTRVLVVDDEAHILNFLRMGLKNEGFMVRTAEDAETALQHVDNFHPHLVVLDLMLPGMDGLELVQRLRRDPDLAIILLTARDQLADRVRGLMRGADDYIVKPFDFDELVARMRAVTRRTLIPPSDSLQAGPITIDEARRHVTAHGSRLDLTVKEYELVRLFLLYPRRVLPRQLILDRVWGYNFCGSENNVEVYVGYLRRKLGDDAHHLIETVRGVGYRLNA